MNINGGGRNLYITNRASGIFRFNVLNGAATSAIYLSNGASPTISASNTVQNTPAAYELANQLLLPNVVSPLLGSGGTNVIDPYTLRITGTLPASRPNYIMNPDPLGLGISVYQIIGNLNVASGARLIINAGTVIKSAANSLIVNSGGTLDIYGSLFQPVIFTSIKDDTVAGDTNGDGLLTSPASREGVSLNYQAGSLGSISFFDMKYSDGFTVSSAIPMNDVSRFKGGFGMKFSGTMNQTVSNLHIDHDGIGGDTALYISGIGTNPIFTGNNTVDKYSGIHDGVIIQTGASPTFQNFTIDLHGANQPALAIYDAATVVTVKNNTIQNADKAVLIANGASPIINNNIIRNSNTGVYLAIWFRPVTGQAGNVTITNNKIVGNNTGIYVHNTTSAIIEHNLIRTNANIGVAIDALQTLPVTLQNNLIVQNGTDL
ncbi:MAG: right-handed parallel beta-helix repeat-containing protein, partial [Ghiorsea sp.]|nr:right-handed parallel beta-helix repeat-containing protein [Ghiorsea sp.]